MTTQLKPQTSTSYSPEIVSGTKPFCVALVGNPNAGKTTLFNALTGMRQKVGNYPGVTVEKKEGQCRLADGQEIQIIDLPGTYSLSPKSPDEEVARDVLLGLRADTAVPDAVIIVVDASNLERNLYFASQVLDLGIPTVIALNMTDVAAIAGRAIDPQLLSKELGAPVVPLVAHKGGGIALLKETLLKKIEPPQPLALKLPEQLLEAQTRLAEALKDSSVSTGNVVPGIALRLLASNLSERSLVGTFGVRTAELLSELREEPQLAPLAVGAQETAARYAVLEQIAQRVQKRSTPLRSHSFTDRADAVLTHKFWGPAIFGLITLLVFQAIFSWAIIPMDFIEEGLASLGEAVRGVLSPGPLTDLLVEGVIGGVGAVVVFVPQILIFFFFIGLLEDTGYMARAAFIMDRLMGKVGLHGRAFIPLMSSFACAIPGIMATRTISSERDRMTTILIAPLMACSARLPVYMLMIATFIPQQQLGGVLSLRAAILFGLYLLGVVVAMAAAWVFKKTIFSGPTPALILELPPYKIPGWRNILLTMWDRGSQFLKRAGTVILAISILLWFTLSYPKIHPETLEKSDADSHAAQIIDSADHEEKLAALQLERSYAGRVGHLIEPVIEPIGFNWKIGVGLIGAMAAREVFVSTLGTVYAVGEDADEESQPLKEQMRDDRWPDGRPVWTTLTAISLLVYFVIAMQCVSTLAIVKRETNGWGWPLFMLFYLTVLAWAASFVVYQAGRLMGW